MFDFDFISETKNKPEPLIPEVVHRGPNTKDLKTMTRKRLVQDILDVHQEEGGKELLRRHMRSDPKAYFELVKKLIPTNVGFDSEEITILLQDQYNNKVAITNRESASGSRDLDSQGKGALPSPEGGAPSLIVKDRFE